MITTLPNLRIISGSTITVPAGQTWLVKLINSPVGSSVSATINSLSFNMFRACSIFVGTGGLGVVNHTQYNMGSIAMSSSLVMNSGDSLTAGLSFSIGYYIMETDLGVSFAIPNLRKSESSALGTTTVPVGQTWIIKIASFLVTTGFNGTGWTYIVSANINGNGYTQLSHETLSTDQSAVPSSVFSGFLNSTLILKAGDSITTSFTYSLAGTPTYKFQLGYWILEQDF